VDPTEHEHDEEQPEGEYRFYVPPEQEGGVYANTLGVWHTAYEFTLDFAAMQPVQPPDPEEEHGTPIVPCRVVSRVRIPVTLLFDVMRALNDNLAAYESAWGEIRRPEQEEQAE
jgi:Protein of unknown function (DUF3467)